MRDNQWLCTKLSEVAKNIENLGEELRVLTRLVDLMVAVAGVETTGSIETDDSEELPMLNSRNIGREFDMDDIMAMSDQCRSCSLKDNHNECLFPGGCKVTHTWDELEGPVRGE